MSRFARSNVLSVMLSFDTITFFPPCFKLLTISIPLYYAEQQNVETSLRANIVAISVSLSFLDEDSSPHDLMDGSKHLDNSYGAAHGSLHVNGQSSDPYMSCFSSLSIEQSAITDNRSISPTIHHLEARCQNLLFTLQVKFKSSALICTNSSFFLSVFTWINFLLLSKPTGLSSKDQFRSINHAF